MQRMPPCQRYKNSTEISTNYKREDVFFVLQNVFNDDRMTVGDVNLLKKPTNLRWKLPLFLLCGGFLLTWALCCFPCPIRHLTGIPCPGCGMGRAWYAALHLNFRKAFACHPAFWAVPVIAVFLLYDCKLFSKKRTNTLVLTGVLLVVAVSYVIRLIMYFNGALAL